MSESLLDKLGGNPMSGEKKVEKFADNPGLPANTHAKKLAKEASKKQQKDAEFVKVLYTRVGSKILMMKVTPKGAKSTYIGNVSKEKEAPHIKLQIEKWKKDKVWCEEHEFQEMSGKIREELYRASIAK